MAVSLTPDTSVAAACRAIYQALTAAGIEDAEAAADARLLVAHVLDCERVDLYAVPERPLGPAAAELAALVDERAARRPMARLLGAREFWGLEFELSADTLVPRPETETLVEAVLAARPDRAAALRIADLGTGTGALLAALLSEYPRAHGVGTDISDAALTVARANLAGLSLADRADFVLSDWGGALAGPFDVIVVNPPYIASADISGLDPEVRDHEPRRALDGGPDGLIAYRRIVADLPRLLAPGGIAVLELGIGQDVAVGELAQAAGLSVRGVAADLAGVPRALVATRGAGEPASARIRA